MKKTLFTGLLVFFLTASASAYKLEYDGNGHNLHWASNQIPVPYRITTSPVIDRDAFINIVNASFGTWQGVGAATISFQYLGLTNVKEPALDGENSILMGREVSGNDVVGQSYIFYSTLDGHILDVDIVLNSSYPWSTEGQPRKFDVQNAATHEIGHFCGLDDLYADTDREKTMYGYMDFGETKKRTLDADDMAGLAIIYPAQTASEDSGGGSGGCGTISGHNTGPGGGSVNFLWFFVLLVVLGVRRLFHVQKR